MTRTVVTCSRPQMPAVQDSVGPRMLWFPLENTILCSSPILSFSFFCKCQGDYSEGSTQADQLSGLASIFSQTRGWVAAGGFVPRHPFIPSKDRFPVLIRRAWLQEAGVGMELLKRKLCACLLEPRGIVSVIGPDAVASTFQWALCGK